MKKFDSPKLEAYWIELASYTIAEGVKQSLVEKGDGSFVSPWEFLGKLDEEFQEVRSAVHHKEGDLRIADELLDLIITAAIALASVCQLADEDLSGIVNREAIGVDTSLNPAFEAISSVLRDMEDIFFRVPPVFNEFVTGISKNLAFFDRPVVPPEESESARSIVMKIANDRLLKEFGCAELFWTGDRAGEFLRGLEKRGWWLGLSRVAPDRKRVSDNQIRLTLTYPPLQNRYFIDELRKRGWGFFFKNGRTPDETLRADRPDDAKNELVKEIGDILYRIDASPWDRETIGAFLAQISARGYSLDRLESDRRNGGSDDASD